jgi:hypothetical protein
MAKKKRRGSYLPAIVVCILAIGWFCLPLVPKLIKSYVPFPKLSDATYLEGTFDYEGEWPYVKVPKYFVVSAQVRHEFKCGIITGRHTCFDKPAQLVGKSMQVWTTPIFGKIQHKLLLEDGRRYRDNAEESYDAVRAAFRHPMYYDGTKFNVLPVFIMLIFLLGLIYAEAWRRNEQKNSTSNQNEIKDQKNG